MKLRCTLLKVNIPAVRMKIVKTTEYKKYDHSNVPCPKKPNLNTSMMLVSGLATMAHTYCG